MRRGLNSPQLCSIYRSRAQVSPGALVSLARALFLSDPPYVDYVMGWSGGSSLLMPRSLLLPTLGLLPVPRPATLRWRLVLCGLPLGEHQGRTRPRANGRPAGRHPAPRAQPAGRVLPELHNRNHLGWVQLPAHGIRRSFGITDRRTSGHHGCERCGGAQFRRDAGSRLQQARRSWCMSSVWRPFGSKRAIRGASVVKISLQPSNIFHALPFAYTGRARPAGTGISQG